MAPNERNHRLRWSSPHLDGPSGGQPQPPATPSSSIHGSVVQVSVDHELGDVTLS